MKHLILLLALAWIGLVPARAQAPVPPQPQSPTPAATRPASPAPAKPAAPGKADAHRAEDIAKHQQMAQAHAEAARCLEAGKAESACQEALRAACKGIAIGQYCGMRHGH